MEMNVYELLYMTRCNDETALQMMQQYFAAYVTSLYKQVSNILPTIDYEEIQQICNLALCDAINFYREDRDASFSTFAILCMKRNVNRYVKKQYHNCFFNQKQILSLDMEITDDDATMMEIVENTKSVEGEKQVRAKILEERILAELTEREKDVYFYRVKGYNYEEIAKFTNLTTKHVDNALQGIKKKTKNLLSGK